MQNIYKLKYSDKETAIADLKAKGVYNEDLSYCQGVHAVVEIGKIIDQEPIFDEQGNIIIEATFLDGYHFDVMCEQEINFESITTPTNPKHQFAGYETTTI